MKLVEVMARGEMSIGALEGTRKSTISYNKDTVACCRAMVNRAMIVIYRLWLVPVP